MSKVITDRERRLRLVERHHHARTASTPEEVVRSVAALHSTDPTTPFISCWARVRHCSVEDLENALYERRTLIRMHAIRRTLFLFDLDDADWFRAGATRDIATKEKARFVEMLAQVVPAGKVAAHLDDLTAEVRQALSGRTLSTRELMELIPGMSQEIEIGSGKWLTKIRAGTRLLLILAMEGVLVRAQPAGSWRSSQYRWAVAEDWFGRPLREVDEGEGRVMVLRRYLETHAPATLTDIRWWSGWTAKASREALAALDAVEVDLEHGVVGYLLPGDPGVGAGSEDVVSFLPSLDSSTMGWKERAWYLGPHGEEVFDSIGNAGPTVWVGGRIVGGWGQLPDGLVVFELLEDVPKRVAARIGEEAEALSEWLGERVISPRFPSPLGKRISSSP